MYLGYGEIMADCNRFMSVHCTTPECPYCDQDILYCSDCQYVDGDCEDCIFYRTTECISYVEPHY